MKIVNTSQNWTLLCFYFWKFIMYLALLLTFRLSCGAFLGLGLCQLCVNLFACIGACVFMATCAICACQRHSGPVGVLCPPFPRYLSHDVRTEVRANAPLRGRRFTSCLSGPSWAESSAERRTVFMISRWFNLSVSLFRLCG